jgi:hypothetical protein
MMLFSKHRHTEGSMSLSYVHQCPEIYVCTVTPFGVLNAGHPAGLSAASGEHLCSVGRFACRQSLAVPPQDSALPVSQYASRLFLKANSYVTCRAPAAPMPCG